VPEMTLGIIGMVAMVCLMWTGVKSLCLACVHGETCTDLSQQLSSEDSKHKTECASHRCRMSRLMHDQWLQLQWLRCNGMETWSHLDDMTRFNVGAATVCVVFNAISNFSNSFILEVFLFFVSCQISCIMFVCSALIIYQYPNYLLFI
jgi:hypothetical protein